MNTDADSLKREMVAPKPHFVHVYSLNLITFSLSKRRAVFIAQLRNNYYDETREKKWENNIFNNKLSYNCFKITMTRNIYLIPVKVKDLIEGIFLSEKYK